MPVLSWIVIGIGIALLIIAIVLGFRERLGKFRWFRRLTEKLFDWMWYGQ